MMQQQLQQQTRLHHQVLLPLEGRDSRSRRL